MSCHVVFRLHERGACTVSADSRDQKDQPDCWVAGVYFRRCSVYRRAWVNSSLHYGAIQAFPSPSTTANSLPIPTTPPITQYDNLLIKPPPSYISNFSPPHLRTTLPFTHRPAPTHPSSLPHSSPPPQCSYNKQFLFSVHWPHLGGEPTCWWRPDAPAV